jgi:hypothetical protein
MLRALSIAVLLTALSGCEEHGSGGPQPIDGPGSGSSAFERQSSPQDGTLSVIVVGLTTVIVIGARRRRREPRVEP